MKNRPFPCSKHFPIILILLIITGLSAACQSTESSSTPAPQDNQLVGSETELLPDDESNLTDSQPQPALDFSDPEVITSLWAASAHANTFVVSADGKNNPCARCHAPIEWAPTLDDLPDSCFTCKFELSEPPDYIAAEQWQAIPCKVCHQVEKDGEVQPEIYWLEVAVLDEYASVENTTELCLKCHAAANVQEHPGIEVGGAHQGYLCSDCHNAHSLTASCGESDCHESLQNTENVIPGHDENHSNVACEACHDGSGWAVSLDEETGIWITLAPWTVGGEGNSESGQIAFTSHNIVLEAACDRCHFANNPWGLSTETEGP